MNIKELRQSTGLTQSEFAAMYHIPLNTYQKWEAKSCVNHRECPGYVKELLERAVKEDFKQR